MKRALLAIAAISFAATAANADVTMKQTITGKGMGMSGTMSGTTYIKGLKMRSDTVTGDTTRTTIFDVDAQKMYMFDSKKKEADVWDMAAFGSQMSKTVDVSQMKGSIKPNGQTKQIAGQTANGYDMEISMPTTLGGQKDGPKMTATLAGPVWIVKGAPGTEDFQRFYKAALDKGWIFGDPRAAQAQPGQAKAMAEMYKQLAETGGIPYEQEMNIKMSGEGPMAGLMAKMGNISSQSSVQSVETGTLDAALFAPPAGYKLNQKK
jgi:hypothetical protein